MLKLIGEYLTSETKESNYNGKEKLSRYVKVLDIDSAEVYSVKVDELKPYEKLVRGDLVEMTVNVSCYRDKIYYMAAS